MARVEENERRLFPMENKDKNDKDDKKFGRPRKYDKYGDFFENYDKERIRLKERIYIINQERKRILREKEKNKKIKKNLNKTKNNKTLKNLIPTTFLFISYLIRFPQINIFP